MHRDLLAQEIHVFLTVAQTLLCGAEFVGKKLFGLGDRVREHDVGLARESGRLAKIPFPACLFVVWRRGGLGMQMGDARKDV